LDGREPALLVLAILLLGISGFLPWWGFAVDTSEIPYNSSEGTDFGPWVAEEWLFQIFPGATSRDSLSLAWWDFVVVRPQYADYATIGAVAGPVWLAAFLMAGVAFAYRAKPRSRMKGWPTVLQVAAGAAIATGLGITAWGLPQVAGYPSFLGVAGLTSWGPKVGWLVALASLGFVSLSAGLGWRTDRALKGLCWKCYRAVSGPLCEYCQAPQ
jgi:hypothetical protein